MNWAHAVSVCGIIALTACSSADQTEKSSPNEAFRFIKTQVAARKAAQTPTPNTAVTVTREALKGINESLIRTITEKTNAYSFLYVAQRNGDSEIWFAPDKVSITMTSGVFTQSRGLGYDLYSADAAQMINVIRGVGQLGSSRRIHRVMDAGNQLNKIEYSCVISAVGSENVSVLGTSYVTTHYKEVCNSTSDAFTNEYWVDSKRIVRVSRQRITDGFGYIKTERLID